MSSIATRLLAGGTIAFLTTLAGCGLPGTATLAFQGAVGGNVVDAPAVTCPAPGGGSDAYATWQWSGTLNEHPIKVTVAALRNASQPDTLTITASEYTWAAAATDSPDPTSRGKLLARVDADGAVHIEAEAVAFNASTPGTVKLSGSLRCPKK
jgi:hypothetical protein